MKGFVFEPYACVDTTKSSAIGSTALFYLEKSSRVGETNHTQKQLAKKSIVNAKKTTGKMSDEWSKNWADSAKAEPLSEELRPPGTIWRPDNPLQKARPAPAGENKQILPSDAEGAHGHAEKEKILRAVRPTPYPGKIGEFRRGFIEIYSLYARM